VLASALKPNVPDPYAASESEPITRVNTVESPGAMASLEPERGQKSEAAVD
jgi:hypothetical protein